MLVKMYFDSEMRKYLEEVFPEINDQTVVFETQDNKVENAPPEPSPSDKYGYIGSICPEEYFTWNWQRFRCHDQRMVDVVLLKNNNILVVRKWKSSGESHSLGGDISTTNGSAQ